MLFRLPRLAASILVPSLACTLLLALFTLATQLALATPQCQATHDGTLIHSTATAVQDAIDDATAGETVKVAGNCTGVTTRGGSTQHAIITKSITLQGGYPIGGPWTSSNPVANPTTLDANGLGRVLFFKTVGTLSNLTVQNGSNLAVGNGGAIFAGSALTLTNVKVLSSTVLEDEGDSGLFGGGLYVIGPLVLNGGLFRNNRIDGSGGGIYAESTVSISGTQFIANVVTVGIDGPGGGLVAGGSAVITGAQFLSNTAPGGGGGANLFSGSSVSGTLFQGNQSQSPFAGGGLWAFGNTTLTFDSFVDNSSGGGQGGGLKADASATIIGGQFIHNSAGGGGGAEIVVSGNISGTLFQGNSAGDGGGVLAETDLFLTNTTFLTNTATGNSGGGAEGYVNFVINGGLFRNNVAPNGGGVTGGGNTSISGTQFIANAASDPGGGGGGFYANGATTTITNAQFLSNTADNSNGAGAYLSGSRVSGTLFQGNQSGGGSGGAVYAAEGVTLVQDTLSDNAANSGGAVYVAGDGITLLYDTLSDNMASSGGGAYVFDAASLALVHDTVSHNTAGTGGGVAGTGALQVTSTVFLNNSASVDYGGALGMTGPTRVVNSLLVGNTSTSGGGALALLGSDDYRILYTTIANPTLVDDSAIMSNGGGTVGITDTIIASHTTGIDNQSGTLYENYNLFFANGADTNGALVAGSGTHDIEADPLFTDPASNDYHLLSGSPAIDAGADVGVYDDFDGNPRPYVVGNRPSRPSSGGGFDIGYDEAPGLPTAVTLVAFAARADADAAPLGVVGALLTLAAAGLVWQRRGRKAGR